MKILLHVPVEQYGFVSAEFDEVNTETIANTYRDIAEAFKPTEGITSKEMDLIIECMALGKTVTNGTELWSKATQAQKDQINCLKRALSRIKAKHSKKKDEEDETWEGAGPGKGENGDYSGMD